MRSIGIIGGGIGGMAAAAAIFRAGMQPVVYERANEIKEAGAGMMLWPNATRALGSLGLLDGLSKISGESTQFLVRAVSGVTLMRLPLGAFEVPALCARRSDVLAALLSMVPASNLRLGRSITGFEQDKSKVRVTLDDGTVGEHDAVIAADGINSAVRLRLFPGSDAVYRGYNVWRGVAQYAAPGSDALQNGETWGRGRRFGILDIGGGRYTFYATGNGPRRIAPPVEQRRGELQQKFRGWHDPIPELIERAEIILEHPACDVPCLPRWTDGRVALLGDAAHGFTPNLGQGGGMAIEDAVVLAKCLAEQGPVERALHRYERFRQSRTRNVQFRSRLIGMVGQWQNPLAAAGRNAATAVLPAILFERNLRRIYSYET